MRWEKTDERERTYSRWHRQYEGEYRFIDIDHVEYCPYCLEPLGLFETAIDVGQDYKCADVTTKIAKKIRVPSYIVLYKPIGYDEIESFRVKQTNPVKNNEYLTYNSNQFLRLLKLLHETHNIFCKGAEKNDL